MPASALHSDSTFAPAQNIVGQRLFGGCDNETMRTPSPQILLTFILSLGMLWQTASAQQKYTLSGTVKDASNGELMISTNVFVEPSMKGTTTNLYGFFSLTVPEGKHTLKVTFLGYETLTQEIDLKANVQLDLQLQPSGFTKDEVVITSDRKDENTRSTKMSTVEIPIAQIKELPALMGEVDILKTLQLMPGVQSASEGNTGLYVRGGGPDQNLVLLDEAVVYNVSHLFGFLSVFNGDAIKNMELTKGGMPAQYGGRLASVLDISMKDGNMKKYEVEGGIGVISSRLTIQGPIAKDRASFIASGRVAYAGLLGSAFVDPESNFAGTTYFFYDLNAKVNYIINDKNRIYLSGYFGRDVFNFANNNGGFEAGLEWGNATTSLRWNRIFTPKLFMNTGFIFSDYDFTFSAGQQEFDFSLFSGIRDFNVKTDFNWLPDVRHNVKFGANYIYHIFTPSNVAARSGDVNFDLGPEVRFHAHEAALYIQDNWDISDRVSINAGLRGSLFSHVGPFNRYIKDQTGQTIIDTIPYSAGQNVKTYIYPEPRISGRVMLGRHNSLKASYTMNFQYIHLASLASVSLPTDLWVPSTDLVRPQEGHQWAAGYFHNFFDNQLETSIEGYYKLMYNLVEYKDGAQPGDNILDNPDNNFTFGDGDSYGLEVFIKKNGKKLTGWVGYTLSWTYRQFPELNRGERFPARYDRRHDLSFVGSYRINERWAISAIFVYGTGAALTVPVTRYFMDGQIISEFGDRNSFRMPDYHRLDLGATLHPNPKKNRRFKSTWNFSIYNVYSRQNPFFIYFATEASETDQSVTIEARQVSIFPILPSVTWNFKF